MDTYLEDSSTRSNANHGGLDQETSEGKNMSNWAGGHSCDIWQRIWWSSAHPKNLPEGKLKGSRPIKEKFKIA